MKKAFQHLGHALIGITAAAAFSTVKNNTLFLHPSLRIIMAILAAFLAPVAVCKALEHFGWTYDYDAQDEKVEREALSKKAELRN